MSSLLDNHVFDDHFHDECGVFGVFNAPDAANLIYLGLHALQHRGQESCGIAVSDSVRTRIHRSLGLVSESFDEKILAQLQGALGIGHVRYSTHGESLLKNSQPLAIDYAHGSLAIAHNGNLTNAEVLRSELEQSGSIFQSTSDTEVIIHLIARSRQTTMSGRLVDALSQIEGAYCLVILTQDMLYAARDPRGFRPLCLGKKDNAYFVASEASAFRLIDAEFVRDIKPGEVVQISAEGVQSLYPFEEKPKKFCIFEYVYFARPDSSIENVNVYEARKRLGRMLAKEQPALCDVVVPVPDSGTAAALGFSEESELPFEMGLVRSHYVGRTFIEPTQTIRNFGVRLKLSPVSEILRGRRVVLVDDSIVRGTTSKKIVEMVRNAGAKEVHLRVSSPPIRWPCFYGIDTPRQDDLIAAQSSLQQISDRLGCDSLGYLSVQGLHDAVGLSGCCDACFTGDYPIAYRNAPNKRQLTLLSL